jgi:chromosome segregation ATPase
MDIEQKIYDLSQKLGVTQGQVNTLFEVMSDIKDSVKSMASDIKTIQQDIHRLAGVEKELVRLEQLSKEVKELQVAKWVLTGALVMLSLFHDNLGGIVSKLWH